MIDNKEIFSEMSIVPLVWAVILHWRCLEHTRKCLLSLQSTTYGNFKVLLVDNGSEASDGNALANEFPEVVVLRFNENKGFAGGCNAGIDYCLQHGAQFIWLLNNDTIIPSDCLDALIKVAIMDESVGACGPALSSAEANSSYGRGVIDFCRGKTFLKSHLLKDPIECDWLSGASLLLRTQALKKTGLFDERYFLYFEDTELCARLRELGFKCVFAPSVQVVHAGGSSTEGKLEYWRAYYYTRNRFLFFQTYCPAYLKPFAFFSILAHIVRHLIVLPFRGRHEQSKLKAELLGMTDFLLRRFGQATCLDWCGVDVPPKSEKSENPV